MTGRANWGEYPLGNWASRAACRGRLDLPWQSDKRPSEFWENAMAEVCATCPIVAQCATTALAQRDGGGMWAGVWVPWYLDNGNGNTLARDSARAMLRRILAKTPLTEVST